MPRYIIERQYLVPIYEHIFVEAPDLNAACREALDDGAQPWGDDAVLDFALPEWPRTAADPGPISRAWNEGGPVGLA